MNTKRLLAAIFAVVILSIGFLSCEDKEDDTNTNPTTSTDVVKEIYGYYGKSAAQVLPILDAKNWTKETETTDIGVIYTYLSADSLKSFAVYSINDTIKGAAYSELENSENGLNKLATNVDKFLLLFEKYELSLSKCTILNSNYQGYIYVDDYGFTEEYTNRAAFLADYQTKKTTIKYASSAYENTKTTAIVGVYLDRESDVSLVYARFQDKSIVTNKSKTNKNSWFRK